MFKSVMATFAKVVVVVESLLNGGHIMENISGLEFSYRFYSHQLCLLVIVCDSMVVLISRKKKK